jgi:hypothetical protein
MRIYADIHILWGLLSTFDTYNRGHDSRVKSKNISPEGVYFEVTTKDIENYSPGKVIKIEIEVVECTNSRFRLPERTYRLIGFGEVVRIDEIDINSHDKKLGVVLKFSEKLKVCV